MTDHKQEQGEELPSIISKKSGTHHPCPNDVTQTHDQGMQRNPGDVNLEKNIYLRQWGVIIPLLWLIYLKKKKNGELQELAMPSICGFCRLTRFSMASGKYPFESTNKCLM